MKIVWSRPAKRDLAKIDQRYQKRIEEKMTALNDRNAPRPDLKKLCTGEDYYRLRTGDYRVIFVLQGESRDICYVVAVKRRTTTTYLHEEILPYGCANNHR